MDATVDDQRDLLRAFAQAHGVPFLDLTPVLQSLAASGATLADPLETHYNDQVNLLLAQQIAGFLQATESR